MCERGILPVSPSSNSTVIKSPSSSRSSSPEGKGRSGRLLGLQPRPLRHSLRGPWGVYTGVQAWELRAIPVKERELALSFLILFLML